MVRRHESGVFFCEKYVCGCVEGVEAICRMAWSGGTSGKYVCGCVKDAGIILSDGME
jgi:hypothetical protein